MSNDAVNFLNSAIGSKVAPRHIIMIIASLGILAGTTFSSGLMEVARKGIFNPQHFYLEEIMVIFLAVMITDVLLLDLYNTFALPTSTTVSIVFELLGAAVAVSIIKISNGGESFVELIKYINTSKAFAIISGILLSVVIAFSVGAIIQFLSRLLFTFNYEKRIKKFGAIWGSLALTAITFFILIKGAKGSSFLTSDVQDWIKNNADMLIVGSLVLWTIVLQLALWFTKINILKPIVLVGTFALALAFAANDLVNFIGVPLAGLATYTIGLESADPANQLMEALTQKVPTPTLILLLAGVIMVITLWVNKKARSVTKTEVNLGRQFEGFERFESTILSRRIVSMSIGLQSAYSKVIPAAIRNGISRRFQSVQAERDSEDRPAFDLIRASVNLMVASILISFATSLKLPLSTTYVTFMVAMGTSLSDKAWGRESAVYRVTGVLTVIGGWFFTALMAFTVSGTLAVIIYYGNLIAIIALVLLAAFLIYRTHILHKKRTKEEEAGERVVKSLATDELEALKSIFDNIQVFLKDTVTIISKSFDGLLTGNKEHLREARQSSKLQKKISNNIVTDILSSVTRFPTEKGKTERRYGKIVANISGLYIGSQRFNQSCYDHIDNNHSVPKGEQINDLKSVKSSLEEIFEQSIKIFTEKNFENLESFEKAQAEFLEQISLLDENQLERISKKTDTSRNSMLFLEILSGGENLTNHLNSLISLSRKNYNKLAKKAGN